MRLRTFIDNLRQPSAGALRAAEAAGYASYHNVVDALRRRTGLCPTQIRGLSQDAMRDVLDVNLPLNRVDSARPDRTKVRRETDYGRMTVPSRRRVVPHE